MAEIGTDIYKAKSILERGKLVSIPTETVYGLGGDALNPGVVSSIFKVKQRPFFDPLIVHTNSVKKVASLVTRIPKELLDLANHFWPGPLTLLLEKKETVPDLVTAGMARVGIRIPNHPLTLGLLETLEFPLAAPSANPFGYVSPTKPSHVNAQLGNKISYILDGGACQVGIESTIVGLDNSDIVIYREGGIGIERISKTLGRVVKIYDHYEDRFILPGMLKSHYSPSKKLVAGNLEKLLKDYDAHDVGLISFRNYYPQVRRGSQVVLSGSGSLDEAAQNLFTALRKLDHQPITTILAELVPNRGLGRAINDRLKRASFN